MKTNFFSGRLLVIIGLLFLLTGQMPACKSLFKGSVDSGTLDGQIYSNKYFGFTLTIPEDWYPLDQETMKAAARRGGRLITGDDKNMKAAVKAAELSTVNLLMAYEHPPGTPRSFNPSIGCVAEKIDHLPGIKTGRDYLLNIKRFLEMSRLKLAFAEDIEPVNIDGVDFDLLYAEMDVGPMTITQEYYASIQKGYALNFVISYANDHQYSNLKQTMASVRFR